MTPMTGDSTVRRETADRDTGAVQNPRLAYLCLQATTEGQASHAHVHEIIGGLRAAGYVVGLFQPAYAGRIAAPSPTRRLYEFVRIQLAILRALRQFDVLYIRSHFAAWPAAMIASLLRVPVVQEVNGPYADTFIAWPQLRAVSRIIKAAVRSQLRHASAVVCVTEGLAEWVKRESGNQDVNVIPNGANVAMFSPLAKRPNAANDYVIFFGALAPWQGIPVILEAVNTEAWPSGINLVIAGDGEDALQVSETAKSNERVKYLGKVPYSELPGWVAGAIASLSPQVSTQGRSETGLAPLKVFESMAAGVPVIVSDFPGQAELVRSSQSGLVVRPGDARALCSAVRSIVANPGTAAEMGRRGYLTVRTQHSWAHRAAATGELVRKVAAPR